MTYLRFHLIFNVPLLVLLAALSARSTATIGEVEAVGFVLLAVMLFTTPWDNLAAKWGIWGFPREKYSLRLGYLPIEEYAFFLLQSINVMLAVRAIFHFEPDWQLGQETPFGRWTLICLAASLIPWTFVAIQLRWLRRKCGPRVNYAVHLAWFLPVVYTQWVIAPPLFWGHAGLLALITAVFGIYYTLADLVGRARRHVVLRREANHRRQAGRHIAVGGNRLLFPDLAAGRAELPAPLAGRFAMISQAGDYF